jgi:hypothetical protein
MIAAAVPVLLVYEKIANILILNLLSNQLKHKTMGLLKTALIGAAVYGAIKYVTKKDINGRSIVDDLKDKAPEWAEKAKKFKEDLVADPNLRNEPFV